MIGNYLHINIFQIKRTLTIKNDQRLEFHKFHDFLALRANCEF